MFEENFVPLSPLSFFEIGLKLQPLSYKKWKEEIEKKEFRLPATSWMTNEESFFHFHMGWQEEGLAFFIELLQPFDNAVFPNIAEGDSVEIFLDTRDVKTSGFNTKFCHHFYFLPHDVDGHSKGEITRFRTEDAHELCNSQELILESKTSAKGAKMKIFIPSSCLVGYDPQEFKRLGFTYRINQKYGSSFHFSVLTSEYAVEQEPSLWASLQLV